jgi:hypothetical protein
MIGRAASAAVGSRLALRPRHWRGSAFPHACNPQERPRPIKNRRYRKKAAAVVDRSAANPPVPPARGDEGDAELIWI